ncbi:alpha/beta hydrolase family protein [Tamaricihabitans halophyticus]|nr:Tat pathway signal protein [Tamaricihabitans halophyticus]
MRTSHKLGRWIAAGSAVAAVGMLAATLPVSAASAVTSDLAQLSLPEPTGPYPVGTTELHLVDESRANPWPGDQVDRELMVSVFYPASRTAGYPSAPYMRPRAAAHFDAETSGLPSGKVDWARTETHAVLGAPVAPGERPVLLYSPGAGDPRTWNTGMVAELASRGYVVITIDNTYESPEVEFPDGSLITMLPPGDDVNAYLKKAVDVRVADTSFVLDELTRLNDGARMTGVPAGFAGTLDLTRVGMFGQSAGGSTAATAMHADPRIRAGINMDGNLTWLDGSLMPVAEDGLDRPLLLLGQGGPTDTGPGWTAFRENTKGWTQERVLRGSAHSSFTDAQAVVPQFDLPPDEREDKIGTIDPTVSIRIQHAWIAGFFDRWL